MPIEPPALPTPPDPLPLGSMMHVCPSTDRQAFRAPSLDRVLASVDFTAFSADLATRRQRLTGS